MNVTIPRLNDMKKSNNTESRASEIKRCKVAVDKIKLNELYCS